MPRKKKILNQPSSSETRKIINDAIRAIAKMRAHTSKYKIPGLARNYKWREWGAVEVIKSHDLSPGIKLNKKGSGVDASSPEHPNQEIKSNVISAKSLKTKVIRITDGIWYFDKQNVPKKKITTIASDAYTFTLVAETEDDGDCYPILLIYVKSESGCEKIKDLLKIKQEQKDIEFANDEAGWDTIEIYHQEIVASLNPDEYYVIVNNKMINPLEYRTAMYDYKEYQFGDTECTNYTMKIA